MCFNEKQSVHGWIQCIRACPVVWVAQPKKAYFSFSLITLLVFSLSQSWTVVWLMGLQQGYKINMAVCQSSVQHMWEKRWDVNKALMSGALGGFLSFCCTAGLSAFKLQHQCQEKVKLFAVCFVVVYQSLCELCGSGWLLTGQLPLFCLDTGFWTENVNLQKCTSGQFQPFVSNQSLLTFEY